MKQLWSVIRFEFSTFAKNKTFVGVTLFLMAIAIIGPIVPVIIDAVGNITAERTIAVVDNTGFFAPETVDNFVTPRATFFNDATMARSAVENGDHNYALEINEDSFILHVTAMGVGVANIQHQVAEMLRYRYRVEQLGNFGVGAAQVDEILMFFPYSEVLTIGELAADVDSFFENIIYAYVMILVLMIGLQMGGAHLLTTVVREKSTKTMELLVTSCAPSKMLNGKVLGVGAALLSQILLMVIAAIVSMQFIVPILVGDAEDIFTIAISMEILGYLVLFFLLGFITYAYAYAALASTASRQEDATSMGQIPALLLSAGGIASFIAMTNPGAAWVAPLSHTPLLAPFIMFVRICMGSAPTWEILVSIGTQIITIAVISWMGTKIYRMGTLMYGAKPTFKNLLEAFK